MTNEEKLQKIIAEFAPVDYTKINLEKTIKDNYVSKSMKDNLCKIICNKWPISDNEKYKKLCNEMFKTLKTGREILIFLEKDT